MTAANFQVDLAPAESALLGRGYPSLLGRGHPTLVDRRYPTLLDRAASGDPQ